MSNIISAFNTTAVVLGYIVLSLLLSGVAWLVAVRLDAWRYRRQRQRQHDKDWDNVRSAWLLDQHHRTDTVEAHIVASDRIDTDVLVMTVEQIYDYQKEHRNDVA